MKRAIVTCVRMSKDVKSGEDNCWVTMSIMPSKMNNGNLYYPKSSDISITTCAGAIRTPDKYMKYLGLNLGDIVNIHYALNEYTQKPFVNDIEIVKPTPYEESDLVI